MSCLCGLMYCEKPVESHFYIISILKNICSKYQVFLDFIMFTQYNQFCVLKFLYENILTIINYNGNEGGA